jgi:hypothetical protein
LFFILASASLIIGMVLKDVLVGPATPFWGQTLYVEPFHQHLDGEFLDLRMKLFPVVISALGILLAIMSIPRCGWHSSSVSPMHLLSNKWYMDLTINHGIVLPWLNACDRITLQVVDKGLIELVGGASGSNAWQEWTTFFQSTLRLSMMRFFQCTFGAIHSGHHAFGAIRFFHCLLSMRSYEQDLPLSMRSWWDSSMIRHLMAVELDAPSPDSLYFQDQAAPLFHCLLDHIRSHGGSLTLVKPDHYLWQTV